MLCHFFKRNWLVFQRRGPRNICYPHWFGALKGETKAKSKSCFILCIHMEIFNLHQRIRRKSHWNSIQELPAYTAFFKDVWLDPLKITKTMNFVAPGLKLSLLSSAFASVLPSYLHSICVVLCLHDQLLWMGAGIGVGTVQQHSQVYKATYTLTLLSGYYNWFLYL